MSAPVLSVLVPFYRDDPAPTLRAVCDLAGTDVEVLAWDDGTGDTGLTERLGVLQGGHPALRVLTSPRNQGRSAARNALVSIARGHWMLMLDADMLPGDDRFLARYLDAIAEGEADVIFGGFTVPESRDPRTRLHRELSHRSDCRDAAWRARHGPQHVASSNLCVRRDVLEVEGFDDGFTGWGWEDSEWAARVSRRYRLLHLDNPAVHLGLETTDTLLHRFATSGPNYARFTRKHPELATRLALYRHARRLSGLPGQQAMRPVLKAMVRLPLPIGLRIAALKLWRASHYADALDTPSPSGLRTT